MSSEHEPTELAHDEIVSLVNSALAENQLQTALDFGLLGVTRFPGSPYLLAILGWVYARSSDFANAESSFRQALCRGGDSAGVFAGLAAVLAQRGKFLEADAYYQRAIALQSGDPEIWFNYGCTLAALGRRDDAIAAFRRATALDPAWADAHLNLGSALAQTGRWSESLFACQRAVAIDSSSWRARLLAASAQLALGSFAEGWDNYEARIESQRYYTDRLGLRTWQGPGDRCRSLVVIPEQGVGTQIMFASCLADLTAHVPRTTVGCDPRLIALLRRSFPNLEIVAAGAVPLLAKAGQFDAYVMAGSLPRHFRRARRDFPGSRYLVTNSLAGERWKRSLAALGPDPKIGISWRGGAQAADAHHRSIAPTRWQSVVELPGIQWVNLQYDAQAEEIDLWTALTRGRFHDFAAIDLKHDLDNAADLVSQLDLVISVVNSTVHLAGALGTPTWTLVPAGGEWRWLADGDECVWHDSVRLFRQEHLGDWNNVVAALAGQLSRHSLAA